MKKKLLAALLAVSAVFAVSPAAAFAEMSNFEMEDGKTKTQSVTASANVTDAERDALGLNVIVSIPMQITLTLNENKVFTGSDKIYAYGITTDMLSVKIDTTNDAYREMRYRNSASGSSYQFSPDNYNASVSEKVSREYFYSGDMKTNYLEREAGNEMPNYSELTVSISNLVPSEGLGEYFTVIPLKIEM